MTDSVEPIDLRAVQRAAVGVVSRLLSASQDYADPNAREAFMRNAIEAWAKDSHWDAARKRAITASALRLTRAVREAGWTGQPLAKVLAGWIRQRGEDDGE